MTIKVLGVCGSPIKGGNVEKLLEVTLDAAKGEKSVETEMVTLAGKEINDCNQCNWCLRKQEEGQFCKQQDYMTELYPKVLEADVLLLATPVYIMRSTSWIYCFMDRIRAVIEGRYYRHQPLVANKVGGAISVAYMRHAGVETSLISLLHGMLLFNLVIAGGGIASPYGVGGLSSKTGAGGFDLSDKHVAAHDPFAIKCANVLAKRAVHLAKIIKAGKDQVPKDEYDSWWIAHKAQYDENLPFKQDKDK